MLLITTYDKLGRMLVVSNSETGKMKPMLLVQQNLLKLFYAWINVSNNLTKADN